MRAGVLTLGSQVSLASQWEDWEGSHEVMSALDSAGLGADAFGLIPPRCTKGC